MTHKTPNRRVFIALAGSSVLAGCVTASDTTGRAGFSPVEGYESLADGQYTLPPIPSEYLKWPNRRQVVYYEGRQPPGTIEIDPGAKFLYFVLNDGTAWRYPIAVGRAGKSLSRPTVIRRKEVWPGWTPTANMLRREPEVYRPFARGVPGGLASPLGARALYLYSGNRDTNYRIHGTNDLKSIGNSGSAGCIRLFNHDIIDLFSRVPLGTRVTIRSRAESLAILGPDLSNRGVELPPTIVSPETIYGATGVEV